MIPGAVDEIMFLLRFFFVVVRSVIKAHRGKVTTGIEGLVGETGTVVEDSSGKIKIMVHGEFWNAESNDEIKKDDKVVVVEIKGMTLVVNKKSD